MNVLFIITDQQRADHMSCAGNTVLKTPNLDRLASGGVRFTNAFVANPTCVPNRASILTGLYPNMHGARSNGICLPENIPTITQSLLKKGWHTISIGKLHHNFMNSSYKEGVNSAEKVEDWINPKKVQQMRDRFINKPYYGYDEVELAIGHGDSCVGHYLDWLEEKAPQCVDEIKKRSENNFQFLLYDTNIPEQYYPTSFVTERSIAFLERYANGSYGNKPFFLFCSYPDPHHPVCPPGKYKNMYKPENVELPSSFTDLENIKKHKFLAFFANNPPLGNVHLIQRSTTEQEARKFIASTYGSVSMIDNGIGQILASLEKLGLAKNTMVIFTSDHGDLCGDHGMILKGPSPFNGVANVPLIWKVPGVTKPGVSDSLVSSIDLSKTILKLLGISKRYQPPDLQGVDITPVLKDPTAKVRDHCLIEEDEEIYGVKIRLRHLITEDYKITVYHNLRDYGDIFDRKNDPDELNNLWFKDKELRSKLLEKLFYENLSAQSRYPHREANG